MSAPSRLSQSRPAAVKTKAKAEATPATERAEAEALFAQLRSLTADRLGISRASYGEGETAGLTLIAARAADCGLAVEFDAAANLVVTLPGADPDAPAVLVGSHMDSVPSGGNFDGAAGIVAGLLCLQRIKRGGVAPPRTIKLLGLRGEESAWFGTCYAGSRALFGDLTDEDLAARHRDSGRTLKDCMQAVGADISRIAARRPLLDAARIAAFYELHIEQGPVMVARQLPVAIVTGIRGNVRYLSAMCHGEAGHSGAVPRWLRRDAVLATADLLHRMDEHWRVLLERAHDLVFTAGIFTTNPAEHTATRIPGEVAFSIDARSQDKTTLMAIQRVLAEECAAVAADRKVSFELGRCLLTEPARMDEALVARLGAISRRLGIAAEELPSGAGHDAAEFSHHGIRSAMIFVRNQNGSHNPQEAMDIADFLLGTDLLHQALLTDHH